MKHTVQWIVRGMAIALLVGLVGGCGGVSVGSRSETITVADELFNSTGTDNTQGLFDGFLYVPVRTLYQAPAASRQAGEVLYAPDKASIPGNATRVDDGEVTLTVEEASPSRGTHVTRTSHVGYFAVLGVPVEVTVNLKVNWRKQTFNVNVTGYTTQPFRVYGSFGSAGPVDPPNFGDTGPLDINVKSAKARYTIQNLGDTAASGKLYISEKPPTQINRDNVETEASLLASVPEEDSIPPGEARHVEGQNILTPLLRQFLENDQTFYVYGLATSSGGTVNVRVTNLQVTVKAEGSLF